MCIEEEIAHRESVGMNTLEGDPTHGGPTATMSEVMCRAILGSPEQRLYCHEIYEAVRERFRYFVIQSDVEWPVCGIIPFFLVVSTGGMLRFAENVSTCS